MTPLAIAAFVVGILWTLGGGALVMTAMIFRDGLVMGGGTGTTGIVVAGLLAVPGPLLILWSVW